MGFIGLLTHLLHMVNANPSVWRCQTYIKAPLAVVEPILVNPSAPSTSHNRPVFDLTDYYLRETVGGIDIYVRSDAAEDQEGSPSYFFLDRRHHSFWVQGGWWYQGVYQLSESERGTLLSYQINNVAPDSSRWLAPLVYWQQRAGWGPDFQELVDTVNARIG